MAVAVTAPATAAGNATQETLDAPDSVPGPRSKTATLDALSILFPDPRTAPSGATGCLELQNNSESVRCLIGLRYAADPKAFDLAADLFTRTGTVAGVDVEQEINLGFRGVVHLVPEAPTGKYRHHLAWVSDASRDFATFFASLRAQGPVRYRFEPLAVRFFRSVDRTTPSAYAAGWTIAYNVSGSLHASATAVRETLFHEVFHLNDADHGDWSGRALRGTFDKIVSRCGTKVPCLRPYAPGDTLVRGGTYYAFQPNNGDSVHEYAAELALRYYREQRAHQRSAPVHIPPFRCGPEENRRAWDALVREFFGGADESPSCPAE